MTVSQAAPSTWHPSALSQAGMSGRARGPWKHLAGSSRGRPGSRLETGCSRGQDQAPQGVCPRHPKTGALPPVDPSRGRAGGTGSSQEDHHDVAQQRLHSPRAWKQDFPAAWALPFPGQAGSRRPLLRTH